MNTLLLSLSAIVFYIIASLSRSHLARKILPQSKTFLLSLGVFAGFLHAAALYSGIWLNAGISLSFFNSASLIAWIIVLLLLISLPYKPVENLVTILFPLAAFILALNSFLLIYQADASPHIHISANTPLGIKVHVLSSILAYSLLAIAALQAVLLAVQDHQLHKKRPIWVMKKLPPLQVMESLLFQMISMGFLLLSISLLSGFLFLEDIFAQHLVHKTILSIIAWCTFALLLWGHWYYGWRGRTAIKWHLSGFFLLMLAYFGTKYVLEMLLNL